MRRGKSALARGFLIPKQRRKGGWGSCHAPQLSPSDVVAAQRHGGIGWLLLRGLSMRVSVSHCTSSQSGKVSRAAVSMPIFQMARLSSRATRLQSNGSLVGQPVTCSPVLFAHPPPPPCLQTQGQTSAARPQRAQPQLPASSRGLGSNKVCWLKDLLLFFCA